MDMFEIARSLPSFRFARINRIFWYAYMSLFPFVFAVCTKKFSKILTAQSLFFDIEAAITLPPLGSGEKFTLINGAKGKIFT